MNEKEMIIRCIKQDKKAQEALYIKLAPKLMTLCMRFSSDKQQAEDFLHNGFIKLFDKIGNYHFKGSFEGWVHRLFRNMIIDELRSVNDIKFSGDDIEKVIIKHKRVVYQPEIIENVTPQSLIRFIQQLSPAYRITFNLFILDDYSHIEIAEKLNITVGTSKSNLSKAKENLKKILIKNGITDNFI